MPHSSRPLRRLAGVLLPLTFAFAAFAATAAISPARTFAWSGDTFSADSEQELFALTNDARRDAGRAALPWDSTLASIARGRSEDMIGRDYFSHNIPPTGEMVWDVMDQDGYCYNLAGENIGWNLNWPDDQATGQIEQSFLSSAEHRDNILGSAWDAMGIGAYKGTDGKVMWTVLFADRCGASKPAPAPNSAVSASLRETSPQSHESGTRIKSLRHGSNNVVWLTFSLGPTMAGQHITVQQAVRTCAAGSGGVRCGAGRSYGSWTSFTPLTTRVADASGTIRVALSTHHAQWLSVMASITDFTGVTHRTTAQQVRWL